MQRAWKRVKANKGAAGVDGLDIAQTGQHLKRAWPTIRQQLMEGTYRPKPVRRVGIPKPDKRSPSLKRGWVTFEDFAKLERPSRPAVAPAA